MQSGYAARVGFPVNAMAKNPFRTKIERVSSAPTPASSSFGIHEAFLKTLSRANERRTRFFDFDCSYQSIFFETRLAGLRRARQGKPVTIKRLFNLSTNQSSLKIQHILLYSPWQAYLRPYITVPFHKVTLHVSKS